MYPRRTGAVPAGRLAKPVPGAASPPDPAPLRLVRVFSAYLSRDCRNKATGTGIRRLRGGRRSARSLPAGTRPGERTGCGYYRKQ